MPLEPGTDVPVRDDPAVVAVPTVPTVPNADGLAPDPGPSAMPDHAPVHAADQSPDGPPAPMPAPSWVAGSPVAMGPSQAGRPNTNANQGHSAARPPSHGPRPTGNGAAPAGHGNGSRPIPVPPAERLAGAPSCTSPQLRRFIKSRAYVPMHELRRRFAIDGDDDDVTQIDMGNGRIYVGLPSVEGHLLGDLLRGGEIGFELSVDPETPIVIGVYAMRPVPRS